LEPVHLIDDFVDLTFINFDIKVLESFFQAQLELINRQSVFALVAYRLEGEYGDGF
jgi:hypothetical protein